MTPLPLDYARCRPDQPDTHCENCKRCVYQPDQTFGDRTPTVNVTGSRDEACIFIPISLQR